MPGRLRSQLDVEDAFRPCVGPGDGILVAWLVEINQKKKRRSLRRSKPGIFKNVPAGTEE